MNTEFDLTETRKSLVAKDNRLIQNSRFSLGAVENKAVTYLISKIRPDDTPGKIYRFNCAEFQALLKWGKEDSYQYMKIMLQNLGDMSWWIDGEIEGKKKDILLRWFNIVRMDPGTGDIEISFQGDMFPYLLDLQKHLEEEGRYFTSYRLQNIALMKHRYSPRIYELLKSYQFNNRKWTFENGTGTIYDLQRRIAATVMDKKTRNPVSEVPESWANWAIFRRDVLDPAVKEINKYTDIKVAYQGKKEDLHHKKTRAIRTIEFYMVEKTGLEQQDTDDLIDAEYQEIEDREAYHQLTLDEVFETVESTFFREHEESLRKEQKEKQRLEAEKKEELADSSKHRMLAELLNIERNAGLSEEKICQLYTAAIEGKVEGVLKPSEWEIFAADLIVHYYDQVMASPEDTRTTPYKRILDSVKKDYDSMAGTYIKEHGSV